MNYAKYESTDFHIILAVFLTQIPFHAYWHRTAVMSFHQQHTLFRADFTRLILLNINSRFNAFIYLYLELAEAKHANS